MGKVRVGCLGGCWDLFHVGHLNYIKEANELCDYLVVDVTPDRIIYEQKHSYPTINERDRMEVVRAIKYVDRVGFSDERREMGALEKYGFDVLFLSEDHLGEAHYDGVAREMQKRGVEVVYLPYTKGISSTKIKENISQRKNETIFHEENS